MGKRKVYRQTIRQASIGYSSQRESGIQCISVHKEYRYVTQTRSPQNADCIQHPSRAKGNNQSFGFRRAARQCIRSRIPTGTKPQKARHPGTFAIQCTDALAPREKWNLAQTGKTQREGFRLDRGRMPRYERCAHCGQERSRNPAVGCPASREAVRTGYVVRRARCIAQRTAQSRQKPRPKEKSPGATTPPRRPRKTTRKL